MNIYLHGVDVSLLLLSDQYKGNFTYARYADDMIIGIRGFFNNSLLVLWKQAFENYCKKIKLEATYSILDKNHPRKIMVLGLVTTIKENGELVIKAPFRRWKKRLTLDKLLEKMEQNRSFKRFCGTLISALISRAGCCFCCTQVYSETH